MNRVELLDKLNLIKPCLSNNVVIPSFSHVKFTKKGIQAFNGTQGIRTSIETGLNDVCVKGDFLIKLLNSYKADEVDLVKDGDVLLLKSGKSKVKISTFPVEDFVTPFEKEGMAEIISTVEIDTCFVDGIKKCLTSINRNGVQEEQAGITLKLSKSGGFLYSTDNLRASRYKFTDTAFKKQTELMLPELFCKQLIKLCAEKGSFMNILGPIVFIDVDDTTLISTIDTDLDLPDFDKIINSVGIDKIGYYLVSDEFKEVVERGLVISGNDKDGEIHIQTRDDNYMDIKVNSSISELSDSVFIECGETMGAFDYRTNIEKLNSSLKEVRMFGFTTVKEDVFLVGTDNENFVVLVACL